MSNVSNGGTCTADLASGVHCLTRQQKNGLVVVALSGFVSLSAVLFIFSLIARNVIYNRSPRLPVADAGTPALTPAAESDFELSNLSSVAGDEAPPAGDEAPPAGDEAPPANRRHLINEPMDLFMLSLFFGSLFQALGVVLEVKWIYDGAVRVGRFCRAQGIFLSIGQSAVSIQTTIITIYTFDTIWFQRGVGLQLLPAWILVGTLWLFLAVFFIASSASVHSTPPFYYPTPYWCAIHSHYSAFRIAGESFWLWLAFAAASLYIPLCFWNVGYISPDENDKWTFKINSRRDRVRSGMPTTILIICAMAYCAPVLPTAMARWFLLVHNDTKPTASAGAQFSIKAIFSLSGVSDVVVFLLARQNLLLFGQLRDAPNPSPSRRPFNIPAPVRIGACVAVWIALNIFDVVWIYYYILSATDPVPRRKSNETPEGWKGYYTMMYLYGFFLGLVNTAVWLGILGCIRRFFASLRVPQKKLNYFLHLLIIVLAFFLSLGPLFAPFIGLKIAQRTAWDRRCDSRFSVEVILEGRPFYNTIKENPSVASFYFGPQPGRRTEYYKYGMTQDVNDINIWHLRLSNASIRPDLDPVYHPLAQDLTYRFANHSVAATCTTNTSSAVTIPCMEGSFNDDGNTLNLIIDDLRTGSVTKLRAVDKGVWVPASDDAPSMLLREVQPDNSLGFEVLRTAVTMQADCTRLKLCLTRGRGIDLLAAVGLILKAQDKYAYTCTTPNSN